MHRSEADAHPDLRYEMRCGTNLLLRRGLSQRTRHAAFLSGYPSKQHALARAENRTEPEYRQARTLGKVIHFSPTATLTKNEFGDLIGTTQNIIGKFSRCIL